MLSPLIVYRFFPLLLFRLYILGWALGWTLGAAYSVLPFHTKRNFVSAGATIVIVRRFLLNFGVYCAVKDEIGDHGAPDELRGGGGVGATYRQGVFHLLPMVGGHATPCGLLALLFSRLVRAKFKMLDVKLYYKHL